MTGTGLRNIPQDLALGYENSFTLTPAAMADPSIEYAAGGLYSTVGDLYRWDKALFTDELLPQDLRDKMFTAYEAMPDSGGLSYGYGCQIGNMNGHRVVGHSGILEGYSTMNVYYPDDQVAVILLGNQRNPSVYGIGIQLAYMALRPVH
jgi:CubicO group peptidase (beta-lactamase class C family)